MSIKKYAILLFTSILVISCNTNAKEQESYAVLDAIFNTILEKRDNKLKILIEKYPNNPKLKKELNSSLHIDAKFSHILTSMSENTLRKSPDIKNDFWVIDYIPLFRNCSEKFSIEDLQLVKDSTYYIHQIKMAPDSIDLKKIINNRVRHYKTELEVYNNIKQYEILQQKGADSITLQEKKKSLLIRERNHFQISYPIFSKDGRYALVYIEGVGLGMQFWILQKGGKNWKRICVGHVGTIN